MIVKVIKMKRGRRQIERLRDNVFGLTRYVVDVDPWAAASFGREPVKSLSEYVLNAEQHGIEPGEKAGHIGARNLMTVDLPSRQAEMLATASAAPRVENPMLHIIVSWPAGERPSKDQMEDTVDTMLSVLDLTSGQVLFAEHTNTDHAHLHIAVGRVDPATGRAAGSDWLVDDAHQALAILEERHGWASEPNALYHAKGGAVFDAADRRFALGGSVSEQAHLDGGRMIRSTDGRFIQRRKAKLLPDEILNNRSAIVDASERARGWTEFHQLLDAYRASYREKGSGGRIQIGEADAKSSAVHRDLSRTSLEARWGPIVPHPRNHVAEYETYRTAHREQLKKLRRQRALATKKLKQWTSDQEASLGAEAGRLRSAIRTEQREAQAAVDAAFATAIKACTGHRHTTVESWTAAGSPSAPPDVDTPDFLLPGARGLEQSWTPPQSLRAEENRTSTRYYDPADRLLFTDHRSIVIVHRPAETLALDSALLLSAERWRTVQVNGTAEFQQACAARAAILNVNVIGPEGRPLLAVTPADQVSYEGVEPRSDATLRRSEGEIRDYAKSSRPHDRGLRANATSQAAENNPVRPDGGDFRDDGRSANRADERSVAAVPMNDVDAATSPPEVHWGIPGRPIETPGSTSLDAGGAAQPIGQGNEDTGPAQSSAGSRSASATSIWPDHRDDPARQQEIERVCQFLRRMPSIPTRRTDPKDASSLLEVVVEEDPFDPRPDLKRVTLFEADPAVQQILEAERLGRFDKLHHHLAYSQILLEKKDIVAAARVRFGEGRSTLVAFDDADFQTVVEQTAQVQSQIASDHSGAPNADTAIQDERRTTSKDVVREPSSTRDSVVELERLTKRRDASNARG